MNAILTASILLLGIAQSNIELPPAKLGVVDGDTVKDIAASQRLRFAGVDSPETEQTCLDAKGQPYMAGLKARDHLVKLIDHRTVTCTYDKRDVYERPISTCTAAGDPISLNERMVVDGWAFSAYGTQYDDDASVAAAGHQGIWQGACATPKSWRREHRVGRARR